DPAIAKDLHRPALAQVDQPMARQHLGRDRLLFQAIEIPQVHDLVHLAERVVEPALRHAPLQRHLATFEPRLRVAAGPRLVALVSAPARLAKARPGAAPDPLAVAMRPLGPPQVTQLRHANPRLPAALPLGPGAGPGRSCRGSPGCRRAPPTAGAAAGPGPGGWPGAWPAGRFRSAPA